MSPYLIVEGKHIGGKATNLIRMVESGFNVPAFKVLPADHSLSLEQVELEIKDFVNEEDNYYAVRSSAVGEDGFQQSFAGLFETYLFVTSDQLIEKIKLVQASVDSERVKFYKENNGIKGETKMAIIIQKMINADVSGVMFGRHPVSLQENEMLISSVYGLGEGLVSGALNSDDFTIRNGKVADQKITTKAEKIAWDKESAGTKVVEVSAEQKNKSSLSSAQIERLVIELEKINKEFGHPQDVEWAFENDDLYILQSRPITTYDRGRKIIWDNSNIIESYPGLTSPLTFSFIREMYKVVYEQFSSLLGIEDEVLSANADVYENMLGLLRGRVYYNLRSWYRALALLPGYSLNAGFMETMMGVKERFDLEEKYIISKGRARWMTLKTIVKTIKAFRRLPDERKAFFNFVDATIKEYQAIDFDSESTEELMLHYKRFESILTKRWDPPLVNDFFAMIYFGVFQKLTRNWIGEDYPQIHNDLLAHSNDIVSIQPMVQSLKLAEEIRASTEYTKLFEGSSEEAWQRIQGTAIHDKINHYLERFGERCLGELKLETISYTQAPWKFIKILQSYIKNPKALEALNDDKGVELQKKASQTKDAALKKKWWKKWVYNYFLRKTRELVSNRENLRFERTRGFGVVRAIFSAMGRRFAKDKIIHDERDIFFLTKEEIFDYIKGTAATTNFSDLVKLRKATYETFEKEDFVPERVVTYGNVNQSLDFSKFKPPLEKAEEDLQGIGCCPGNVRAEILLVHSPEQIDDLAGRIMVTSSTDPGWVSLFPTASGILVERGSLLSHSAIVARELGIPCIVAVDGLLAKLKSGQLVEMDGSTGVIKVIENGEG